MANTLLFLAVLCAGASLVFNVADSMAVRGSHWANSLCSAATQFCHNPLQVAYIAAGLAVLGLMSKLVAALRD